MLYYKNLFQQVFDNNKCQQADEIVILSGYVGLDPIRKLSEFPSHIKITVIYGMYGHEQIAAPLHKALIKLNDSLPNVEILYSTIPVHSKIYIWKKNEVLKNALIGSANFTRSGLENDYKEVLSDVDANTFSDYDTYYSFVRQYCISCKDPSIIANKRYPYRRFGTKFSEPRSSYYINRRTCVISLLDDTGEVPLKSGLNWCLSNGHVAKNDAYIRIPSSLCRTDSDLFPPKKHLGRMNNIGEGRYNRENDEIEILWEDGTIMPALLEGSQQKNGMTYPKQISSSPSKSVLGSYIRNRLGVSSDHVITKKDLLNTFGHTDIIVSLISDGVYHMSLTK